jgi:hypothetical protein
MSNGNSLQMNRREFLRTWAAVSAGIAVAEGRPAEYFVSYDGPAEGRLSRMRGKFGNPHA